MPQTTEADAAACAAQLRRSYLDATRVYELSSESQADSLPWISQSAPAAAAPAPVAVNPTDAGVNVRASLGQVRDYNAQMTAKKIEAAKAFAPKAAPNAAPPAAPKAPLDVWSSLDVQGLEGEVSQTTRTGVGADYKISPKTTVGVVAERGATDAPGAVQEDHKVAAFMNFRAAPAFTIDARTQWEEATPAPGATTEKNSVSVAPRLGKSYALDHGKTIEPFVTYKQEFDIGSAGLDAPTGFSTTQSAGAGLTYAKPDAYSLSVTTDVESVGAKEPANVNSKLQLKVPIR